MSITNERLVERIQADADAAENMQILFEQNLGLIRSAVGRYAGFIDFDDAMQEAFLALVKAAQRWQPGRGAKFSTYAVHVVSQHLRQYVADNSGPCRLPADVLGMIREYKSFCSGFLMSTGRLPTETEAKACLGLDDRRYGVLLQAISLVQAQSMDAPLVADEEAAVGSLIPGEVDIERDAAAQELEEAVRAAVDSLEYDGAADVIRGRWLDGDSVVDVAARLEIAPERVRALEKEGLKELSKSSRLRSFHPDELDADVWHGNGVKHFKLTHTSGPEAMALRLERRTDAR